MKFRSIAFALAPFALAGLPVAAPAYAQDAAQSAQYTGQEAEYVDLYNAIEEGIDQDALIETTLNVLRRQFQIDPNMRALEAMSAGTIDEIVTEIRPLFIRQSDRIRRDYRPQMQAIFAQHMTPEEATVASAFYRSDLGRKLMGNVSNAYSPDATLSDLDPDREITVDQVEKDINNAAAAAVSQMSREELMEAGRLAMQQPALMKLGEMAPDIAAMRAKMENEPLTSAEEKELEGLVMGVLKRRFPGMLD